MGPSPSAAAGAAADLCLRTSPGIFLYLNLYLCPGICLYLYLYLDARLGT